MNWWANLYFAEGPGIEKDAPPAVGLRRFGQTLAREWWALILVNVVFVAAILPVVTLPAAVVGLFRVTALIAADEPCEPWREFRETFVAVFWPATLGGAVWIVALALGWSATGTYARAAQDTLIYVVPLVIACVTTGFILTTAASFAFLLANHRAPLRVLAKAAALATLLRPLPILAALGGNLALWLIHVAAYPSTILMALMLNFSLGALFVSFAIQNAAQIAVNYTTTKTTLTE